MANEFKIKNGLIVSDPSISAGNVITFDISGRMIDTGISVSSVSTASISGNSRIKTKIVGKTNILSLDNVIYVDDYGAVGDGITDDTASVNAAISACPSNGTVLFNGTKTYFLKSLNSISKSINLDGQGCSILCDVTNVSANGSPLFSFSGTLSTSVSISAYSSGTSNVNTISAANANLFQKDDLVLIENQNTLNQITGRNQLLKVNSVIPSANGTIALDGVLYNSGTVSTKITKILPIVKPTIKNFFIKEVYSGYSFNNTSGILFGTSTPNIIDISYSENATISDININGFNTTGISIGYCYGSKIDNCDIKNGFNNSTLGNGIGIAIIRSSNVKVLNSHFENVRHGIEWAQSYNGSSYNNTITFNNIGNNPYSGIRTLGYGSYDISSIKDTVYNANGIVIGSGIYSGDYDINIDNFTWINTFNANTGVYSSTNSGKVKISKSKFLNYASTATGVQIDSGSEEIKIDNTLIVMSGGLSSNLYGVLTSSTSSSVVSNLIVTNSQFVSTSTINPVIKSEVSNRVFIDNCMIYAPIGYSGQTSVMPNDLEITNNIFDTGSNGQYAVSVSVMTGAGTTGKYKIVNNKAQGNLNGTGYFRLYSAPNLVCEYNKGGAAPLLLSGPSINGSYGAYISSNGGRIRNNNDQTYDYEYIRSRVTIDGSSGTNRIAQFSSSGNNRWTVGTGTQSEFGGNTGSNFEITAFDDNGNLYDVPVSIPRISSSNLIFGRTVLVNGNISASGNVYSQNITNISAAINNITSTVFALQSTSGSNSNGAKIYYVDSYGAVGDGITDDTAAVNAAISACASGATLQFNGNKTYFLRSLNTITKNIRIDGNNANIICDVTNAGVSGTLGNALFGFAGNIAGTYNITGSITQGTTTFTANGIGSAITKGTYIQIVSDKLMKWWSDGTTDVVGATRKYLVQATQISGNTVTFQPALPIDMPSNVTVNVINWLDSPIVENFKNITEIYAGSPYEGFGFDGVNEPNIFAFQYCSNVKVRNNSVNGFGCQAISTVACNKVYIDNCKASNAFNPQQGGIGSLARLTFSTQTYITNSTATTCRQLIDYITCTDGTTMNNFGSSTDPLKTASVYTTHGDGSCRITSINDTAASNQGWFIGRIDRAPDFDVHVYNFTNLSTTISGAAKAAITYTGGVKRGTIQNAKIVYNGGSIADYICAIRIESASNAISICDNIIDASNTLGGVEGIHTEAISGAAPYDLTIERNRIVTNTTNILSKGLSIDATGTIKISNNIITSYVGIYGYNGYYPTTSYIDSNIIKIPNNSNGGIRLSTVAGSGGPTGRNLIKNNTIYGISTDTAIRTYATSATEIVGNRIPNMSANLIGTYGLTDSGTLVTAGGRWEDNGDSNDAPGSKNFYRIFGPTGVDRGIFLYSNTSKRMAVGISQSSETGGNAGSNFFINAYDDSGNYLDTPLIVERNQLGGVYMVRPNLVLGSDSSTNTLINVNSAPGNVAQFTFSSASTLRWTFRKGSASETGANAGSPFELVSFDDSGNFLDAPLIVNRSPSGSFQIYRTVQCSYDLSAARNVYGKNITTLQTSASSLQTQISTKISEAPTDGKLYARQNSSWIAFTSGGGTGSSNIQNITKVSSNYTCTNTDYTVLVNTISGSVSINLATSPSNGQIVNIKKSSSDTNYVTVVGTIDNAGNDTFNTKISYTYQYYTADNSWYKI